MIWFKRVALAGGMNLDSHGFRHPRSGRGRRRAGEATGQRLPRWAAREPAHGRWHRMPGGLQQIRHGHDRVARLRYWPKLPRRRWGDGIPCCGVQQRSLTGWPCALAVEAGCAAGPLIRRKHSCACLGLPASPGLTCADRMVAWLGWARLDGGHPARLEGRAGHGHLCFWICHRIPDGAHLLSRRWVSPPTGTPSPG